jgi:UMF1 family MFS transporter
MRSDRITENKGGKGAVLGWALYDWANSAFVTTVVAGFFPLFFKEYYSIGVDSATSTARLGLANSLAGLAVALLAPLLGAVADQGSFRKRFLFLFAGLGVAMTFSLYLIPQGSWALAGAVFALAVIGFSGSNVFYDSLLPFVAPEKRRHYISSLGYALGYLGGGLLFAANVLMFLKPPLFGLADGAQAVRVSFLTVGLWWAVFSVPLLLLVREPAAAAAGGISLIVGGFRRLAGTISSLRRLKPAFIFLLAYWCYIDGVDTIIRMAVDYGLSLGFPRSSLIIALLITQFVGFPSALVFGRLGTRIGAKRGIYLALAVYLLVTVWGALMTRPSEFYVLAVAVGLVQGGVQALSRSFFAGLIPQGRSAEFFGFYNMIGKFAVVLGPALMGGVALALRSAGLSGSLPARLSIASVALFFIGGGIILSQVKEEKAVSD